MEQEIQLKQKSKKNRLGLLLAPVLVLFAVVMVIGFVSVQVEINVKNAELNAINDEIARIETENQQLARYLKADYKEEYIESIARDELGFARPEERIYYIIPAD